MDQMSPIWAIYSLTRFVQKNNLSVSIKIFEDDVGHIVNVILKQNKNHLKD